MRFFFVIQFERQILACFIPSVFHYKIIFYHWIMMILTLEFDTWIWCLILTLDFQTWFWRLILTLDFWCLILTWYFDAWFSCLMTLFKLPLHTDAWTDKNEHISKDKTFKAISDPRGDVRSFPNPMSEIALKKIW